MNMHMHVITSVDVMQLEAGKATDLLCMPACLLTSACACAPRVLNCTCCSSCTDHPKTLHM